MEQGGSPLWEEKGGSRTVLAQRQLSTNCYNRPRIKSSGKESFQRQLSKSLGSPRLAWPIEPSGPFAQNLANQLFQGYRKNFITLAGIFGYFCTRVFLSINKRGHDRFSIDDRWSAINFWLTSNNIRFFSK